MERNILIVENDKIISDNVAKKLKKFFIESVESLEIETADSAFLEDIDDIIKQYKLHPSILKIK